MLSREQQDIIENSIWVVNTALKKQGLQADEDLRQSAILYMCKCLERFDPNKNIKWTTYAYKNVYLFIKRNHLKEFRANSHIIPDDIFNLVEPIHEEDCFAIDGSSPTILAIKEQCTEEECQVLDLKLQGYKGAEISQIMRCSTSKVTCCMQSIKEKAKEIEFWRYI